MNIVSTRISRGLGGYRCMITGHEFLAIEPGKDALYDAYTEQQDHTKRILEIVGSQGTVSEMQARWQRHAETPQHRSVETPSRSHTAMNLLKRLFRFRSRQR